MTTTITIEDLKKQRDELYGEGVPALACMIVDYLAELAAREAQPTQVTADGVYESYETTRVILDEVARPSDRGTSAVNLARVLAKEVAALRAQLAACERECDELRAKPKPDEGWRGKCEVRLCDKQRWWGVNSPGGHHFLTKSGWLKHDKETLNSGYFNTESAARAALASAPPPPDVDQPKPTAVSDDAAAAEYADEHHVLGDTMKRAFLAGCAHARRENTRRP